MSFLERYIQACIDTYGYHAAPQRIRESDPELWRMIQGIEERLLPPTKNHWPNQTTPDTPEMESGTTEFAGDHSSR